MKKIYLVAALGALLLGASCASTSVTQTTQNTNMTEAISYTGQDGKTALELLAQTHTYDATKEGFITTIDGRSPGERQFWAFYVNGQQATVGAKDYNTKNDDQIEWRLEAF